MRRRDFIKVLGATAAGWPFVARAQQSARMQRIGMLMSTSEADMQTMVGVSAFVAGLEERGWTPGGNVQIEYRWTEGNGNLYRRFAQELVALAPDVILVVGGTGVSALQQETRTLPIVFVATNNPIERGLITSIERPGGNTTGFIDFEFSMGRKWLEVLKQIAPDVSRVAVIRNPLQFSGIGLAAIEKAAPSFGVEVSPIDARAAIEMERSVTAFARDTNGGLIVTPSPFSVFFRDQIITLADRHKLPTVYFNRYFVTGGGLVSYGPDILEQYRGAAGYVDRILKGEKPADMPVQAPTKFELVVNLRTAKALGLNVPDTLVGRADEVIK
jgi:putative tryptophan/tyrosine transport system substrate-binding protein